ncbi:MAG: hypothetical protein ACKO7B_04895, partial [Flavobacteriales bacterium]
MSDISAESVAEKCMLYCLTFGIPDSVLTDRGTNFTSQVIDSLWEMLDVHTLRTTAYHPQTDGITERFNRTVKEMLAQFVNQHKQDDWNYKLEKLTFAYNTSVHATTKFSPFELIFGRIPKLPIDLVHDQTDSTELKAKIDIEWTHSEFVEKQKEAMKSMFHLATHNRNNDISRMKTLHERNIRGTNFKNNDRVWMLDSITKKGVNPKLKAKWKGPYTVVSVLNEVDAALKADGRSKKSVICHFSKLKRCFGKPANDQDDT